MSLHLSERQKLITQSEIRNMTLECQRIDGINLAQGVCNLPVPEPVRQGAHAAIEEGYNVYTRYDGLSELREAIARQYSVNTGLKVDPESQVVVSAGTTGAFYSSALALLNPDDEVILFEPYYSYHVTTLKAVGAKPVYVRMQPPGWSLDPAAIEQAITPRTRGMILNTPANPSGKVFSATELQMLADIAQTHDLFVFTDEIYANFVYDNRQHIAPATIEGMQKRTITMSGFSKIFSITGWRIGYCISDPQWARSIGHINDLIYVCAPAPLQIGVARGIDELESGYYADIIGKYQPRRDKLCAALAAAGFEPYVPQGAYYILADISRVPGATSKDKALELLQTTGIASVPGQAFFHDGAGNNLARFCFAKEDDVIDEACQRIKSYTDTTR